MAHVFLRLLAFLPVGVLFSQIGGRSSFEFLNLPLNARQSANGGENISLTQNDPNRFFFNPALLDSSSNQKSSISYISFPARITAGLAGYTFSVKQLYVGLGFQYINYGQITGADELGDNAGVYTASEFSPHVSVSHPMGNFALGGSLKLPYSNIGGYTAGGLMFDIGGSFRHPSKDLVVSMVFKNLGFGLKRYTPETSIIAPFDLQIGTSFKPEHMPVRFSITLHKLYRYDVSYYDPKLGANRGAVAYTENKPDFLDKSIRHLVVGSEIVLSKNLSLLAGYNFLRRKELRVIPGASAWAGFSFGALLNTKKFGFEFSRSIYHPSGAMNTFTLVLNLAQMMKKNKTGNAAE